MLHVCVSIFPLRQYFSKYESFQCILFFSFSVLRPSIAVGRRVGQIVTDYQQVVDNIQTAANISQLANSTAHMAMERVSLHGPCPVINLTC